MERRSRRKRSALQSSAEAPGPAGRLAFPNQGITGKEPDPFTRIGVAFGCRNATHHTAALVAEDGSLVGTSDFHYWCEILYLSAKGNWFLHAAGGAMTAYADHQDGHSSEGERIIPMGREEALGWCEKHHAQEAIDKHFADMISEA